MTLTPERIFALLLLLLLLLLLIEQLLHQLLVVAGILVVRVGFQRLEAARRIEPLALGSPFAYEESGCSGDGDCDDGLWCNGPDRRSSVDLTDGDGDRFRVVQRRGTIVGDTHGERAGAGTFFLAGSPPK